MADGTEYQLSSVLLERSATASIDINAALAAAPPDIASHISDLGSAALRFDWAWRSAVSGNIVSRNVPKSLLYEYPFGASLPMSPGEQVLEGLWWKHDPGVGGFVALANPADQPRTAKLQIIGSRGTALPEQAVALPPHTTQMLDLGSLLVGLPEEEQHEGGMRVTQPPATNQVLVSAGLENDAEGYSAQIPLWRSMNHEMTHATGQETPNEADAAVTSQETSLALVGIMVNKQDPVFGFPATTVFSPFTAMRNTTSRALHVKINGYYMNGTKPVALTLPPQNIEPHHTKQLNMPALLAAAGFPSSADFLTLQFTVSAQPGEFVLAGGSVDQTATYVSAALPSSVGPTHRADPAPAVVHRRWQRHHDRSLEFFEPGTGYRRDVLLCRRKKHLPTAGAHRAARFRRHRHGAASALAPA